VSGKRKKEKSSAIIRDYKMALRVTHIKKINPPRYPESTRYEK
jgi:hypothetical protein